MKTKSSVMILLILCLIAGAMFAGCAADGKKEAEGKTKVYMLTDMEAYMAAGQDAQDAPAAEGGEIGVPEILLSSDNRFLFTVSYLSDYMNIGTYETKDGLVRMTTEDEKYTFVFKTDGDNLIYDKAQSSEAVLDSGVALRDGAVFELVEEH